MNNIFPALRNHAELGFCRLRGEKCGSLSFIEWCTWGLFSTIKQHLKTAWLHNRIHAVDILCWRQSLAYWFICIAVVIIMKARIPSIKPVGGMALFCSHVKTMFFFPVGKFSKVCGDSLPLRKLLCVCEREKVKNQVHPSPLWLNRRS